MKLPLKPQNPPHIEPYHDTKDLTQSQLYNSIDSVKLPIKIKLVKNKQKFSRNLMTHLHNMNNSVDAITQDRNNSLEPRENSLEQQRLNVHILKANLNSRARLVDL